MCSRGGTCGFVLNSSAQPQTMAMIDTGSEQACDPSLAKRLHKSFASSSGERKLTSSSKLQ